MPSNENVSSSSNEKRFYEKHGDKYSIIDKGLEFKGDLIGKKGSRQNIKIAGVFNGNINIDGVVLVEKSGEVHGDINSACIIVAGKTNGSHIAFEKIEVRKTASIHGIVQTPHLAVAEGSDFNGDIKSGVKLSKKVKFVERRK